MIKRQIKNKPIRPIIFLSISYFIIGIVIIFGLIKMHNYKITKNTEILPNEIVVHEYDMPDTLYLTKEDELKAEYKLWTQLLPEDQIVQEEIIIENMKDLKIEDIKNDTLKIFLTNIRNKYIGKI